MQLKNLFCFESKNKDVSHTTLAYLIQQGKNFNKYRMYQWVCVCVCVCFKEKLFYSNKLKFCICYTCVIWEFLMKHLLMVIGFSCIPSVYVIIL